MKTHNAVIYHCQHCGNVVHREPELEVPDCCGNAMVTAAVETIYDDRIEVDVPTQDGGRARKIPAGRKPPPKG